MIIGRGGPPQWIAVHPARVEWIRARLAVTGLLVIGAAVMTAGIGAFRGSAFRAEPRRGAFLCA